MRLLAIRHHLASYQEARRILAANFTSVAERRAALHIRDEFLSLAPGYVKELIGGIDELIKATDGEECHEAACDGLSMCVRCRIRCMGESQAQNAGQAI